jgi:hypothetical protein
VLLLKTEEHAAEVVADKVLKQLLGGVTLRLAILLEYLVGQLGACLKGEMLRLNERVVAVEQDVFGLGARSANAGHGGADNWALTLPIVVN